MQISHFIRRSLNLPTEGWADWIPADHIVRQAWQEEVEHLICELRMRLRRPAFGLAESEISAHYHLPVAKFITLIKHRLGVTT